MKFKNIVKGKQSQKKGADFEQLFKTRCLYAGLGVTRIPDGCKRIGGNRLVRVRSPFDWIVSGHGQIALLDTKVRSKDHMVPSDFDEDQALEMAKHQHTAICGFVTYLIKTNKVNFYPVYGVLNKELTFKELGPLESFNPSKLLYLYD